MEEKGQVLLKIIILIIILIMMIGIVSICSYAIQDNSKTYTKAYFCAEITQYYGNADCILLENKDENGNILYGLIDAGRFLASQNNTSTVVKDFLEAHNVTSLEFVVITHMHDDHYGSIVSVLNTYEVETIYIKDFDSRYSKNGRQEGYEEILRIAVNKGINVVGVGYNSLTDRELCPNATQSFFEFMQSLTEEEQGKFIAFNEENTEFQFGSANMKFYNWEIFDTEGNIWIPGISTTTRETVSNENNNSLVLKLTQGNRTAVFTGDLNNLDKNTSTGRIGDEDRIKDQIGVVDFLKLGHHGSANSNTEDFLDALAPKYAAITSNVGWRIYTNTKLVN